MRPGENFVKMTSLPRADGLPDGVHTGGCWQAPNGEVWKSLVDRPHPGNTPCPTQEAECLTEMVGLPGFPNNWRVEHAAGQDWLVRRPVYLWPQTNDVTPRLEDVQVIEQALRAMNEHGWEYNDLPQLAYDLNHDAWFLLDLSAAFKPTIWQSRWHGDFDNLMRFYAVAKMTHLKDLRQRGRSVVHAIRYPEFVSSRDEPRRVLDRFYPRTDEQRREHTHVYASTYRPMNALWASIPGTVYLPADLSKSPRVHTWVASDHLLPPETLDRYQLTYAYHPWP